MGRFDRKRLGALLVVVTGVAAGGLLWVGGTTAVTTRDFTIASSSPVNWTVAAPGTTLHARAYLPRAYQNGSATRPGALLFHGLGRTLEDNDHVARLLVARGVACLSLSFRGHGRSSGIFPTGDLSQRNLTWGDALGAYRALRALGGVNASRVVAIGTSMGGGAALYLGVQGLVPRVVGWYPAVAYAVGTLPLYSYNLTYPGARGLILAGTADAVASCRPELVTRFADHNPGVTVTWLEGATHTDSRFYLACVATTLDWLAEAAYGTTPPPLDDLYHAGWLGAGVAAVFAGVGLAWGLALGIKRVKRRSTPRAPS